jgi:hypothetical protein
VIHIKNIYFVIHIINNYSIAHFAYLFCKLSYSLTSLLLEHTFIFSFPKLYTMASKLKPNATTAKINEFLAQLRIPNFCIHPRLVEFNNAKDRQRKITLLRNKLIAKGLPENAAQTQSEELADANTLSVGVKSLTQKGLVLMLAGLEEKDLEQQLSAEANTHVMLVFLKEKKVSNLNYLFNLNTNSL